jgi:curved DNA-binding protein CbpA
MAESEAEGLVNFLFYVIIVYPVTNWLLKKYKDSNRGMYLAICFLGLIAAGKTYLEVLDRGPNYYSVLGVTRTSTSAEIRKSWKQLAVKYHPDKNMDNQAWATSEMERIKEAYDILINEEQKAAYNKFGKEGTTRAVIDEQQILLTMAVFYLTWGMLAYILTLGKSSKNSRDLIYTGMIVMLVVEVSLSLQDVTLPEWFLPTVTEYEIVWLLKTLFPAYMNGCRCLGGFYYKDVEEETRQSLAALRDSHAKILAKLNEIVEQVNSGGGSGKPATKKVISAMVKENINPEPQAANVLTPQSTGQKSGNMGFYLMIAGYIIFYSFFQ